MGIWLKSRLLSYCTILEFFDYLAEYAARKMVTVRSYVVPSEFVDIVDSTMPVSVLVFYEILVQTVLFGVLFLVYKLVKRERFSVRSVLGCYGKILFWTGIFGVISRLMTYIAYVFFVNREYIHYDALGTSFSRDALYLLSGILLWLAVKYIPVGWRIRRNPTASKRGLRHVFVVLFVLSVGLNVYLFFDNSLLYGEHKLMSSELSIAREEVSTLQQEKANFDKTLLKEKHKYTELYYEKIALEKVIRFFDEHIALVVSDGSMLYHTYDCRIFQDADSFKAYNVKAAENDGYKPCKECH